ncbi:MAG TPA: tetratricopeptide repeat protein, partial [Xanthomonadaceae bacterium]|nr:tetratricopeptide repeat protein [Xanthomonadaceae bacterium]
PYTLSNIVNSYQVQGRLEDSAKLLDSIPRVAEDPGLGFVTAYQRTLEHRYPEAIVILQSLHSKSDDELNGFGPLISLQLGIAQRASGDKAKAQATFEQLAARIEPMAKQIDDTDLPVTLARAYAFAGNQKAALEQARRAVDLFGNDALQRPTAELGLAEVQMLGGDRDAAIAGLAHSLKVPVGITQPLLRLDPIWDPLRGDPRFTALLKN